MGGEYVGFRARLKRTKRLKVSQSKTHAFNTRETTFSWRLVATKGTIATSQSVCMQKGSVLAYMRPLLGPYTMPFLESRKWGVYFDQIRF